MRETVPGWTPERRSAQHGTRSKYTLGCRCAECREANRLFRRAQNYASGTCAPKVSAARVRPLVSCLVAFGIERQRLAEVVGVAPTTLRLKRPSAQRRSVAAIESLHWGLHRRHARFRAHCGCRPELLALDDFGQVA